jgi:hypothetical protein
VPEYYKYRFAKSVRTQVEFIFLKVTPRKVRQKLKGKVHPRTGHEGPQRGSRGIALLFL